MKRKYTKTTHKEFSVRRKEFAAVEDAYANFQALQKDLAHGLDSDVAALRNGITLRRSLKALVQAVNKQ